MEPFSKQPTEKFEVVVPTKGGLVDSVVSAPLVFGHSSVYYADSMWVFGGINVKDNTATNRLYSFDFGPKVWLEIKETSGDLPTPKSDHTSVVYQDKMYVLNGRSGKTNLQEFHSYDFSKLKWTAMVTTGKQPPASSGHRAVVYKDSMFVFEGIPPRVYKFNFLDSTWSLCSTYGDMPGGRSGSQFAVLGDKLYLHGGLRISDSNTPEVLGDTHSLDPVSFKWTSIITNFNVESPKRFGGVMIGLSECQSLYLFGGCFKVNITSVKEEGADYSSQECLTNESYVFDGTQWKPIPHLSESNSNCPSKRIYHTIISTSSGNAAAIFGGISKKTTGDEEGFPEVYMLTMTPKNSIEFGIDDTAELSRYLIRRFDQKEYSDVVFKMSKTGENIYCNKMILCSRSPQLRNLIQKAERQQLLSTTIPPKMLEIVMDEKYQYRVVWDVLLYAFCGDLTLNDDTIYDVISFCSTFGLTELRNSCFNYLSTSLDKKIVHKMLMQAKNNEFDFDCTELVRRCMDFIDANTTEVLEDDGFLQFDEDIMIKIFSSDKIQADEADLYRAMVKWGNHQLEIKKRNKTDGEATPVLSLSETVKNLLPHIRVPLIDAHDLILFMKQDSLISKDLYKFSLEHNCSPDSFRNYNMRELQPRSLAFFGSTLINFKFSVPIFKWLQQAKSAGAKKSWKLLYKASKDGYGSADFHKKCDMKGETLTIIQASSTGYIFGGYNPQNWMANNQYTNNANAFLFSLQNSAGFKPTLCSSIPGKGNYVYNSSTYGPTWGGGHDLYLCSGCNSVNSSYSNIGFSYSVPGQTYGSTICQNFLAGSYNFKVADIEVFAP